MTLFICHYATQVFWWYFSSSNELVCWVSFPFFVAISQILTSPSQARHEIKLNHDGRIELEKFIFLKMSVLSLPRFQGHSMQINCLLVRIIHKIIVRNDLVWWLKCYVISFWCKWIFSKLFTLSVKCFERHTS